MTALFPMVSIIDQAKNFYAFVRSTSDDYNVSVWTDRRLLRALGKRNL